MTRTLTGLTLAIALSVPGYAVAQEAVWLQIEARASVASASAAARSYATRLENVSGFSLGNGYYGIALGPYAPADAVRLSEQLKARGAIPQDAYIVTDANYGQQFYPVGTGAAVEPQPLPGDLPAGDPVLTPEDLAAAAQQAIDAAEAGPDAAVAQVAPEAELDAPPEPEPEPEPEETRAQALAAENGLGRQEKQDLQIALQWAGFYDSAIDGLFGPGTRGAMSAWQESRGLEQTGVLTTAQRAELLAAYNAVLDGMDLALVRDTASGIEMVIPTGVVEFTEYEPPFVKFEPSGDLDARVYFISQDGDEDRFFGFYEILQTLEIVPEGGERSRSSTEFEIDAADSRFHTYARASRQNGTIKGYMLVWPAGDEERRRRVLDEMRPTFTRIDGVLDPAISPPDEDQAVNLIAGLQVRQPLRTRSGFYVSDGGAVLTAEEAVAGCSEITVEGAHRARVVHSDADLGIAVVQPEGVSPIRVAAFQTAVPRLRSDVAVAGYSYGGLLGAPGLTFGTLEDLRGLDGAEDVKRLALTAQEGDAGGPVFDEGGAVLGMLLPDAGDGGRVLPPEVSFVADSDAVIASLESAGLEVRTAGPGAPITREMLTRRAAEVTVLISCW